MAHFLLLPPVHCPRGMKTMISKVMSSKVAASGSGYCIDLHQEARATSRSTTMRIMAMGGIQGEIEGVKIVEPPRTRNRRIRRKPSLFHLPVFVVLALVRTGTTFSSFVTSPPTQFFAGDQSHRGFLTARDTVPKKERL